MFNYDKKHTCNVNFCNSWRHEHCSIFVIACLLVMQLVIFLKNNVLLLGLIELDYGGCLEWKFHFWIWNEILSLKFMLLLLHWKMGLCCKWIRCLVNTSSYVSHIVLCCQSGNAARRGHPKNWCRAGCGCVAGAISVTRTLIYLILKYYTVERKKILKYLYSKFMKYS